jgi:hypothetical protein
MTKIARGFFDGEKGQTLFDKPFLELAQVNRLPELFQKVDGLDDHRLLALITALLVEDRVDKMLRLVFPRYNRLLDRQEYSFSMKLTTLEALRYLPSSILNTSQAIRKIRNEFAHSLDLVKFDDLDDKIKKMMISSWKQSYGHIEKKIPENLHEIFKNISFFSIAGLDMYMTNVSALHSKVCSQEFIDSFAEEVARRNNDLIEAIKNIKPNESIIKDDIIIVCKDKGKSIILKGQNDS